MNINSNGMLLFISPEKYEQYGLLEVNLSFNLKILSIMPNISKNMKFTLIAKFYRFVYKSLLWPSSKVVNYSKVNTGNISALVTVH